MEKQEYSQKLVEAPNGIVLLRFAPWLHHQEDNNLFQPRPGRPLHAFQFPSVCEKASYYTHCSDEIKKKKKVFKGKKKEERWLA